MSDRYKIFAGDWLWIKVCQNNLLSKIYDNNKQKKWKIDKGRILRNLDQLLKIQHLRN